MPTPSTSTRQRSRGAVRATWLLATAALLASVLAGCTKEEETWVPIDVSGAGDKTTSKPNSKPASRSKPTPRSKPAPHSKPSPRSKPAPASKTRYPSNAGDAARIERSDTTHLRARARTIHRRLVAALRSDTRANVAQIPLHFDKRRGEVNAFAACLRRGGPILALSDGLMQVQAQLARAQANDERFGGSKLDAYISRVSRSRNLAPPAHFIPSNQEQDSEKRARQAQLLDEGLAFVIGHELAHHALSHTGCVGNDAKELTTADLGRLFSRKVRGFNQPNELASDVYGIQNVLAASTSAEPWKEDGALLLLRFFKARTRGDLKESLMFTFEHTHPHPDVRTPVIKETASTYRLTGGKQLPTLPNIGFGKQ